MRKKVFITALLSFFIFAGATQAVVSTSTVRQQIKNTRQDIRSARQETRQEIKETRQEARQEIKGTRQDDRQEIKETRQEARQDLKNKRQEAIQQIKDKRDELRAKIDNVASSTKATVLQKREALKAQIQERRANLKEKLKQIKDERKQKVVERVDEQLRKLNEKMTDHFLAVLTRLEKVLNNIKARADKAESAGKNVAAVRTAIIDAQNLIDSTREAAKTQDGKLYNVTISGEEAKLRAEVGKARQALHADLAAVRKLVQTARDAVHKAATTLAQIPKVDDDNDTAENTASDASSTDAADAVNQ